MISIEIIKDIVNTDVDFSENKWLATATVLENLAEFIPDKYHFRLICGVLGISLQKYESINGNGCLLSDVDIPTTGISRLRRAIDSDLLRDYLQVALAICLTSRRRGRIYLNIDHTKKGGFTVFMVSLQTRAGRSIPFWFQVNEGPKNQALSPLLAALDYLTYVIQKNNPNLEIVYVGDRWFGSQTMMEFCQERKVRYLLRTKSDKKVSPVDGLSTLIKDITESDSIVNYKGLESRLSISGLRPGMKQPWYILSDLKKNSLQSLFASYSYRWEIESTIRDIKQLQQVDRHEIRTAENYHSVLLFTAVGWMIAFEEEANQSVTKLRLKGKQQKPKKKLSLYRRWFRKQVFGALPQIPKLLEAIKRPLLFLESSAAKQLSLFPKTSRPNTKPPPRCLRPALTYPLNYS